jgi:hypothetical protein
VVAIAVSVAPPTATAASSASTSTIPSSSSIAGKRHVLSASGSTKVTEADAFCFPEAESFLDAGSPKMEIAIFSNLAGAVFLGLLLLSFPASRFGRETRT